MLSVKMISHLVSFFNIKKHRKYFTVGKFEYVINLCFFCIQAVFFSICSFYYNIIKQFINVGSKLSHCSALLLGALLGLSSMLFPVRAAFDSDLDKKVFPFQNDSPSTYLLGTQDAATDQLLSVKEIHFIILMIQVSVFILVICMMLLIFDNISNTLWVDTSSEYVSLIMNATMLEILWCFFPSILLIIFLVPSFTFIYAMLNINTDVPRGTLTVIGRQWYWAYNFAMNWFFLKERLEEARTLNATSWDLYKDMYTWYRAGIWDFSFEQRGLAQEDIVKGGLRNLEVDEHLVLKSNSLYNVVVTSEDVIHCWAIPSLGMRIDAIPGKLNSYYLYTKRSGVFFGQCAELCGANHAYMPIALGVNKNVIKH